MEKKKTREITEINVVSYRSFKIGDLINDVPIAYFEDKSIQIETGKIESYYVGKSVEDDMLVAIENSPVVVFYKYTDVNKEISKVLDKAKNIVDKIKKPLN